MKPWSIARRGVLRQGPGAIHGASFIMLIGARLVWPKDEPTQRRSTSSAHPCHPFPTLSACEMFQEEQR